MIARIIRDWNEAFRERRRRWVKRGMVTLVGGFLLAAGLGLYVLYLQAEQASNISGNRGTLRIDNVAGATLELACIRAYGDQVPCPGEPSVVKERALTLPGSADYMLTARKDDWTQRYPMYIEGIRHELELRIEPPPGSPPDGMAYIPAGVFRMGDKDDEDAKGSPDELPDHDVYVSGFYIDRHEVTNEAYQRCVKDKKCKAPHYDDGSCFRVVEKDQKWEWEQGKVDQHYQESKKPVVCVEWQQAKTYCEAQEKRLPTEAEWEKAAAGPEGYKWSFGNEFDGTQANFCDARCVLRWRDAKVNDGQAFTAPVGTYPKNGYGLYDMSGNVWEWVEDGYDEKFYATEAAKEPSPVGKSADGRRVVRGGSWLNDAEYLRAANRGWDPPEGRGDNLGFRCVRPPK